MIPSVLLYLRDTLFVAWGIGDQSGLGWPWNLSISMYGLIFTRRIDDRYRWCYPLAILKARGQSRAGKATVFTHAMVAGIVLGLIFLSVAPFSEQLGVFLGADAVIFEMTNTYLRTILLFGPVLVVNSVGLFAFVRNDGNPNWADGRDAYQQFSAISYGLHSYLPQMGMFGAALATGIARSSAFLSLPYSQCPCTLDADADFNPGICGIWPPLGLANLITEILRGLGAGGVQSGPFLYCRQWGWRLTVWWQTPAFYRHSLFFVSVLARGLAAPASYSHGRGELTVLAENSLLWADYGDGDGRSHLLLLVLGFQTEIVADFNR